MSRIPITASKSMLFPNKYLGHNEGTHLDFLGNILSGQHGGVGRGLVTVSLHLHATGHPMKRKKPCQSTKSKKSLPSGSGMFNPNSEYRSRVKRSRIRISFKPPKIISELSNMIREVHSGYRIHLDLNFD